MTGADNVLAASSMAVNAVRNIICIVDISSKVRTAIAIASHQAAALIQL
jgi:hypothetical protein